MTNIKTASDARTYVVTAINAGDASSEEYDIEAICDELRDLADGWDFDVVDHDDFWAVIAKHDLNR